MSTLHTVNKSPYERNSAASAFAHLRAGDAVLLIEDGVLGARRGGSFERRIGEAQGVTVYALKPDLDARGLKPEQIADGVKVVAYDGFVDLAAAYDRVCAWL
jgi:tRNA 2-thiouridine synthesizing protein B